MSEQNKPNVPQPRFHIKEKNNTKESNKEIEYFDEDFEDFGEARIKVIGVGGAGGNAVANMVNREIKGVEFIVLNTDVQDLKKIKNKNIKRIQIGKNLTKGLGAGTDPEKGEASAEEDIEVIKKCVSNSDMVFITAGMGGGTGSGAAKVVAREAKNTGALTVGVVTKPFKFEGNKRLNIALDSINSLREHIDSIIVIPNEKLQEIMGGSISIVDAFKAADNVLHNAVQGISEIITNTGIVNVDFADVRTVMENGGTTMMGSGTCSGEERGINALENAIGSKLLDDIELNNAKGILVNITTNNDLQMSEYEEIGAIVHSLAKDDATIVIGTINDEHMKEGDLKINVVASGLDSIKNDKSGNFLSGNKRPTSGHLRQKQATDHNEPKNDNPEVNINDLPTFLRKNSD